MLRNLSESEKDSIRALVARTATGDRQVGAETFQEIIDTEEPTPAFELANSIETLFRAIDAYDAAVCAHLAGEPDAFDALRSTP